MSIIYGSSRLINPNIIGITGNTGPTGSTGPAGNRGETGNTGNTGNTGGSVIGMTLSGDAIVTEFSDGTFRTGRKILGKTGNYILFADGANISVDGFDLFAGLSQEVVDNTIVSSLRIRGFTTASQNSTTKTIEIVSDPNNKVLGISYNLRNLSYIGISSGSEPQLLVYDNNQFKGLTGTAYDKSTDTVDFQVTNYGERVHFISPIRKDVVGTASIYFYWPIDWKKGNIFKLGSYSDQIPVGKTTIAQLLLIENPIDTSNAYGITIIAPPGVTSSNSVFTGYATTTDVNLGITLSFQNTPASEHVTFNSVSWPLGYAPCLTQNTDVITSVFIDGIWYSNFGVYNKNYSSTDTINIDEVEFVESYFNCAGSERPDDPILPRVNCCDVSTGICSPNIPVGTCNGKIVKDCSTCFIPPPIGICCEICTGVTSATIQSGCTANAFYSWSANMNTTCTDPDGPNASLGICCYKNGSEIIKHSELITDCECAQLAQNISNNKKWTPISFCNKNLDSIDCTNAFNGNGSCCDGVGNCTITTQQQCATQSRYFNGVGTVCSYSVSGTNFERCKTGTGGCCTPPCTTVSSQSACSGKFYGCGTLCNEFPCVGGGGSGPAGPTYYCCLNQNCTQIPTAPIPNAASCISQGGQTYPSSGCGGNCSSPPTGSGCQPCNATETNKFTVKKFDSSGTVISTTQLKVGDFFAGGIVVGVFNPNGATCLGNHRAHGGMVDIGNGDEFIGDINEALLLENEDIFDQLNSGGGPAGFGCKPYRSVYSPDGYGFTLSDGHNKNCDSWLLIVSPFPVMFEMHNIEDANLFAVRPKFNIEADTSQSTPESRQDAEIHGDNIYKKKIVNTFVFSAGNTSFCPSFDDVFDDAESPNLDADTPCNTPGPFRILANRNYDDGGYGTLPTLRNQIKGSTYWGNTTTFDTCPEDTLFCSACGLSPSARRTLGSSITFTRNTGYFHRNWGQRNCARLFASDLAIYYLRGNIGVSTNKFQIHRRYKDPAPTFGFTFGSTINARTTIAEATSVYNGSTGFGHRWDASGQGYIGPSLITAEQGLLYTNPGYYGPEYMRDQGYPQVSRWYVPSIDELAFIAHKCQTEDFQTKLSSYSNTIPPLVPGGSSQSVNGIRIGNYNNTFVSGASGWVWSSTGTFNEGNTGEYIQATGGAPFVNSDVNGNEIYDVNGLIYNRDILRDQFTKAWAIKFADSVNETNPINYRVKKLSDTLDKAEVRLVRMIRCDNRYFKNEGTLSGAQNTTTQQYVDEELKNNCWNIPRLTASAIVNGSEQINNSAYNSSNIGNSRNIDFKFSVLNTPP